MGREQSVVVVDDEADIVEAMKMLLEFSFPGIRVLPTLSPEKALELAKNGVGLLVTDYRMPGMDGLELARRAHKADEHLPIIMVTAYRDSVLQDAAGKIGIDVIQKPFEPGDFVDAVGASLGSAITG